MNKPIRHLIAIVASTAAAVSASTLPADAAPRDDISVSFFQGGDGKAHWSREQSRDADDKFSMKLEVPFFNPATDPVNFAGIDLHHEEGQPAPAQAPAFDFYPTKSGPSLGSPRLVMIFSDGGRAELRPLAWLQNTWTRVGDGDTNWDNNGGTCGFLFQVTYETVLACHAGQTVTSAFVVSDSGYAYPPDGYVHYIDNLEYDGKTISEPSDNRRS